MRSLRGIRSAHASIPPDERYRVERTLAIARVFLAVSVVIAGFLGPVLNPGPPSLIPRLLDAYVVVAVIVLLLLLLKPARWTVMTVVVHVIDLSMAAAVMLATDPRAPIGMLVVFVLVAAAHRWGLRAAILTAAVVIAPLLTQAVLAGMTQGSFGVVRLTETVGLRQLIVGPALLLLGGVVLAYLAQAEKQFRAEAAALGAVVSRVQLRSELQSTMAVVFDDVVQLADAKRALLIVHETATGRVSLWEGGRLTGPSALQLRVTTMEAGSLEHYMFVPEAAAWYAVRRWARRERLDVVALDHDGSRSEQAPRSFPEPFLAAVGPFRRLMAIGFEMPGELTGRLFLVDPHVDRDPETTLAFGQRMVRQLSPAVHNVYLLRRLRSRSAANERARVALELHDGIIQGVLGVEIQLHALSVPAAQTSQALAAELIRLGGLLRNETASLRYMMQGLMPRELPPEQLMDALAEIVQRFQRDTGITARFITPLDCLDLRPRACREVTRIVQEALVNVQKHSGAQNVIVQLTVAAGVCQLSIDDDGRGFPYAGRRSLDPEQAHGPLWSIRERVRVLGGQVTVESADRGARIEISFPLATHATH